jgi:hypothetical protein
MSTTTPHLNPRAAAARRMQRNAADVAARITAVNARRVQRIDAGVSLLMALVVAALLGWALVIWATPCEGTALCMAAVIPTRPGWLYVMVLRLRAAYLRRLIRSAQCDLAFQRDQEAIARWELDTLPRLRAATRQQIDVLELQLADIELATRGR